MDFKTPITTIAAGKAWIESLAAGDMLFHFEDAADTIVRGATMEPLFTPAEAIDVRERVAELYALDWSGTGYEDPIGYALFVFDSGENTQHVPGGEQ